MPAFKPEELSEQALHIIHLSDIHYEKKTTGSNLHFWQLAEQARHSATSTADKKNVKRDALKKLSYEEGVGAAFSANLNGQVFLKTK